MSSGADTTDTDRSAWAARCAVWTAQYAERIEVADDSEVIGGRRLTIPGYQVTSVITPQWQHDRDSGYHVDVWDRLTEHYVQWTSLRPEAATIADARLALARYLAEACGAPAV
jgi:hypothetical protein